MSHKEHRAQARSVLGFAAITVSDTRSEAEDRGGQLIAELVTSAEHRLSDRSLVRDEVPAIRAEVARLVNRDDTDVVVLTGGTGYSPRDLTVEAVAPLFERPVEGFGELFRMLSWEEVGAAAMLSRATAGLLNGRLVYVLPGSPAAVRLAMERLILPESAHLLGQTRRSSR